MEFPTADVDDFLNFGTSTNDGLFGYIPNLNPPQAQQPQHPELMSYMSQTNLFDSTDFLPSSPANFSSPTIVQPPVHQPLHHVQIQQSAPVQHQAQQTPQLQVQPPQVSPQDLLQFLTDENAKALLLKLFSSGLLSGKIGNIQQELATIEQHLEVNQPVPNPPALQEIRGKPQVQPPVVPKRPSKRQARESDEEDEYEESDSDGEFIPEKKVVTRRMSFSASHQASSGGASVTARRPSLPAVASVQVQSVANIPATQAATTSTAPQVTTTASAHLLIRGARKTQLLVFASLTTINSLPYKYCLKLVLLYGDHRTQREKKSSPNYLVAYDDLEYSLVYDEEGQELPVTDGITIEKHMKTVTFDDRKEIDVKIAFNVYSHSFGNKAFKLQIYDKEHDRVVVKTQPFMIFARRNRPSAKRSRAQSSATPDTTESRKKKRVQ